MTPEPIAVSIVGDAQVQAIPAVGGTLKLSVVPSTDGFRVTDFRSGDLTYAQCDLREGDLLLNIDGRNLETVAAWDEFWNRHPPIAGDPVSLLVRRDGQSRELRVQCPPNGYDMFSPLDAAGELSPRRSGFPAVFVHDAVLTRGSCGGPLVDLSGKIVGINIARAARHATYAIPSNSAQELTRRLSSRNRAH
jgi:serine protease Do